MATTLKCVYESLDKTPMGKGAERRKHRRIRTQLPCEIALGGRVAQGTVRDLSAGGLSIQAAVDAQEGDALRAVLHPRGRDPVEIEALVWNIRRGRRRSTGAPSARLGLVLSTAPDAFLALLEGAQPAPERPRESPHGGAQRAEAAPEPPPSAAPEAPRAGPAPDREERVEAEGETTSRYVVRVRKKASSRTRRILVFAESADDAGAVALGETGPDWSVLDVAGAPA